MLGQHEVVRKIKPVDLSPVLAVLGRLDYLAVGLSGPDKYKCDVVLRSKFPQEIIDLLAGLGLGGSTARAVIRRLAPRQSIPPHTDKWMPSEANWRRFQVPLISHPDILMRWPDDDASLHLEPGFLYEVRFDRTHEVVHPADCERIHLQIDQVDATI